MHCDYCFYCDEAKKRAQQSYGRMSEQTLKNLVRKTLPLCEGSYALAFQGGEPTLRGLDFYRTVVRFIRHYNRNRVPVSLALQTNGYALDEEWAEFLGENHFLAGLSVDGLKNIHNRYRHGNDGGDSYRHIVRAAKLLDLHHVDYNILTVVHRETAEHIAEIYDEYRARGWRYLQFIACLDPIGEKRGQKEFSLLPETYGRFLITLFDKWYEDYLRGSVPYIRQFENYIGILLGYVPESCEQMGYCTARQLIAEADGSIYPCDFYVMDDYRTGNINTDSLMDIYDRCEKLEFAERSRYIPDRCRQCRWFHLCRNGCYRNRNTGRGEDGVNYFCEGFRMFFERCYERMKQIAESVRTRS